MGVIGYEHVPIPHLVIDVGTQALGDTLARLAVIPFLFTDAPHVAHVHVLCARYITDFARQMYAGMYPITIHAANQPLPSWLERAPLITLHNEVLTTLRIGLLEHAHLLLLQRSPEQTLRYPQVAPTKHTHELPTHYIVGTLDYTAASRALPVSTFEQIADSQPIPVVLLGNDQNVPLTERQRVRLRTIIDLRNKTTLSEAHAIIDGARAIFGIDNGLLHLAATTATPIVAGYTTVAPKYRALRRLNGEVQELVPPDSSCRFCQTDSHFVYGNDYRNCFKYTRDCIKSLTADKWIAALRRYLPMFDHTPIAKGGTHD